ncbi:Cytochrome P450 monooxygenase [Pseudocercospora fuligena]|uniref:Cytochrome P450 monooxygenase n=1 Tax=Pseudocercospora fuligena TaxID=685502 RepID=A0A8H6RNA3_9PEZI|nr:Cytochrome P450 monooxygenase [Pseudocercospora fuligena]
MSPKLAGLTYLYQSYYDLYPHQGRWLFQQIALHDKYGPIVRVGPDEIHISNPKFYDTAFGTAKRKRDKSMTWYWFVGSGTNIDGSAFGTLSQDQHAIRRSAMNPFFSMKKVRELEDRIRVHVEKTRTVLEKAGEEGTPINLLYLMSAMTMDIISEYSFGKTVGLLDTETLGSEMRNMFERGIKVHPFARQFRLFTISMMRALNFLASHVGFMRSILEFDNLMDKLAKEPYDRALRSSEKHDEDRSTSIIESMVNDPHLSQPDRAYKRIRAEAANLIGAGTETTARTLAVGLYYILSDPEVHKNLLTELRTIIPTPSSKIPSTIHLSKLPYLTACIHESTRLAHGVAGRLVRIAPDEDIACNGYTIPRGSTFSMSHYIQHMNPEYFPEPEKFKPERYLGDVKETMRYLVPFGRGPRACLGMNLA